MKAFINCWLIIAIAMFIASGCGGSSDNSAKAGKLIIKSVELKDSLWKGYFYF